MQFKQLKSGGLLVLALGLSACGNDAGVATSTVVSGRATQGPVSGATIFADRASSGTVWVKDSSEAFTSTNAAGNFTLSVPAGYGDYVLVSQNGTDTLTGKPAMQMMAPADSLNVTPLTTLVALAPANQQAALKALIQATGVSFDADISSNATPAALLLAKSIETAIETLDKTIDPNGNRLSAAQLLDVQRLALTSIAASAANQPTLLTSAALQNAISTGVAAALPAMAADGVVVAPADIQTIATAVAATETTVATSLGNASGNLSTTATATEAGTFTTAVQNSIDTAITTQSAEPVVVVVHPVVVSTATTLQGISIQGPVSVVFSGVMNAATITTTSFTVKSGAIAVPGAITYNSTTKTATFTPTGTLAFSTTYTVTLSSTITDASGVSLTPATLSFTTVAAPVTGTTGATGATGTSGTGANF